MDVGTSLFGFGEHADERRAAFSALTCAGAAIARLDADSANLPLRAAWLRAEREFAFALALRETGHEADPQSIIAARLGALLLPRGHVQLGDVDDRARRWAPIAQRKGQPELRALVARLVPTRGDRDLVGLAERTAEALGVCSQSSWEIGKDPSSGLPVLRNVPAQPGAIDAGDLALALPYALRRAGVTVGVLSCLVGRPRLFSREGVTPLVALTGWATALERQACEGHARLRQLQIYAGQVEQKLAAIRRPAALRRLVGLALGSWSLWAAKLARQTKVDISSAWRLLEQAADLGLVMPVPGQKRSRGDATLYAAPPWLRMAGLMLVRRGRPPQAVVGVRGAASGEALAAVMAEFDSVLEGMDQLLAR